MREGSNDLVIGDKNVRLLRALAEELRLPLLQIARQSELARLTDTPVQLQDIATTADAALRLIDSYLFSTQVLLGQGQLDLTPVSLGAAMYNTAEYLGNMAKLYDCDLDIALSSKAGLAMAHAEGLQAALTSLAYTFITSHSEGGKQKVVLSAHNTEAGIAVGVLTTHKTIAQGALTQARNLVGAARRPLRSFTHTNGAGIYVADSLFAAMNTTLKVHTRRSLAGLTAGLLPSRQLALL